MTSALLPHLTRFTEFINSGDVTIGKEVISPNATFHVPFGGPPLQGKSQLYSTYIQHTLTPSLHLLGLGGYLQILGMMRSAFPDIQWTIKETIAEGDKIVCRFETRGTHNGPFMGVAPTGKSICMTALNIYRFENGQIVEELGQPDIFGLMVQIGAIPVPGP